MKLICRFSLLFFIISIFFSCNSKKNPEPLSLKVMSFNIWVGGGKSIDATARVFLDSNADIIGVQEATRDDMNMVSRIADSIGWYSYAHERSTTILSKYPIVDTSQNKYGVKIAIDEQHYIWMFNMHLIHCPYEPYQLNGIEYCGAPMIETEEEAVESAKASRGKAVENSISDIMEAKKEGYPIFLTGDFNEPSCLDWTERGVEAGLCKIKVAWPSTKAYMEKAGMKDSYRIIYPDEVRNPGHTWTTLPETSAYDEVLDRIDFVFFSGDNIELINSQILGENSSLSDIKFDNYPSDHRAVISTFSLH